MLGKKYTSEQQHNYITMCEKGQLDVCVLSVSSAKNGANLQGMVDGVIVNPITSAGDQEQCMGNVLP